MVGIEEGRAVVGRWWGGTHTHTKHTTKAHAQYTNGKHTHTQNNTYQALKSTYTKYQAPSTKHTALHQALNTHGPPPSTQPSTEHTVLHQALRLRVENEAWTESITHTCLHSTHACTHTYTKHTH